MKYIIEQEVDGTWSQIGDEYSSRQKAQGVFGGLSARGGSGVYRITEVKPVVPVNPFAKSPAFVMERYVNDRSTGGEVAAMLWLQGLPIEYIDANLATPSLRILRPPQPLHRAVVKFTSSRKAA